MLRRLGIAAAYTSCCFLNSWITLSQLHNYYFLGRSPVEGVALPLLAAQVALTTLIVAVWPLFRKLPGLHWWILAACVLPFAYAGRAVIQIAPFDMYGFRTGILFWPFFMGTLAGMTFSIIRWPKRLAAVAFGALRHAWPVLLLVYGTAAWQMLVKTHRDDFADRKLAGKLPASAASAQPRVLWIIFDELSRPAADASPVFGSFARRGFHANHARAAGSATLTAMPSLIDGKLVSRARGTGPDGLLLEPGLEVFGKVPNVFDTARSLGRNTALIGWYHPYCRILSNSLTNCAWVPIWNQSGAEEFLDGREAPVITRLSMQARVFPLLGKHLPLPPYSLEHKIAITGRLVKEARKMAVDPAMGLILLHLPVPHPPHVYDRRTGGITTAGKLSYLDGVAQAERIFEDLLGDLEASGLRDRTAILVSSDHGYRDFVWRSQPGFTSEDEQFSRDPGISEIPFLVQLPQGGGPAELEQPFNTVITRKLIEAILAGRLHTHSEIADLIRSASAT